MVKLTEKQFKEYAKANPENIALIRKNNMNLMLISDMECCENNCLFRIEQMSFKLDIEIAFLESMVDCRRYYAGGIIYIFEEGQSFDTTFDMFINQSYSDFYCMINNNYWKNILKYDFDEAYVVII